MGGKKCQGTSYSQHILMIYLFSTSMYGVWMFSWCSWEIMTLVTSYPHLFVIFFLFVEAAKELRTERKKTGTLLNSIFIFGVYDNFEMKNVFLNQ